VRGLGGAFCFLRADLTGRAPYMPFKSRVARCRVSGSHRNPGLIPLTRTGLPTWQNCCWKILQEHKLSRDMLKYIANHHCCVKLCLKFFAVEILCKPHRKPDATSCFVHQRVVSHLQNAAIPNWWFSTRAASMPQHSHLPTMLTMLPQKCNIAHDISPSTVGPGVRVHSTVSSIGRPQVVGGLSCSAALPVSCDQLLTVRQGSPVRTLQQPTQSLTTALSCYQVTIGVKVLAIMVT